jgi:hypothetical protein
MRWLNPLVPATSAKSGHTIINTLPPGHGATLEINGQFITSYLAREVKEASYLQEIQEYISKNAKWNSLTTFHTVDWHSRHQAAKKLKGENKLTVFKLEFGNFATMAKRHLYELDRSPPMPPMPPGSRNS